MGQPSAPRVAVLGATSQIARDWLGQTAGTGRFRLELFARDPVKARAQLGEGVRGYQDFPHGDYDVVVNFVGVGDPARLQSMGASILDVTQHFDQMALDYQERKPSCRYIFLSSGAAYGAGFREPAGDASPASFSINSIQASDYYSIAKFYAECRHRARPGQSIVDLRVFSYFSRNMDLNNRFLTTDIVRAIKSGDVLQVSAEQMVRDYLHPEDFAQLIGQVIEGPPANTALDCYSAAPLSKRDLLEAMRRKFGLRYEVSGGQGVAVNASGGKAHYYSTSRKAAEWGYVPRYSSLDCVMVEAGALIAAAG